MSENNMFEIQVTCKSWNVIYWSAIMSLQRKFEISNSNAITIAKLCLIK